MFKSLLIAFAVVFVFAIVMQAAPDFAVKLSNALTVVTVGR